MPGLLHPLEGITERESEPCRNGNAPSVVMFMTPPRGTQETASHREPPLRSSPMNGFALSAGWERICSSRFNHLRLEP